MPNKRPVRSSYQSSYYGNSPAPAQRQLTISSNKRLPPIPSEYKSPFESDEADSIGSDSDASTISNGKFSPKSKTLSIQSDSSVETVSIDKTKSFLTREAVPYTAGPEKTNSWARDGKGLSFMDLGDRDENDPVYVPKFNNYHYSTVSETDTTPEPYLKRTTDVFNRNNLAAFAFVLLSCITTVISVVTLSEYTDLSTAMVDQDDVQSTANFFNTVRFLFSFLKLYGTAVSILVLFTQSNSQTVFLLIFTFLTGVIEIVISCVYAIQATKSYQTALSTLASQGMDLLNLDSETKKSLQSSYIKPRDLAIISLVFVVVSTIGQILIWLFYLSKHFSWQTFKKTGASVKARKVLDDTNFFYSLLIVLCGLLIPFHVAGYTLASAMTPFYANSLFVACSCPFIFILSGYAYKKKSFLGLSASLAYFCYCFLSTVLMISIESATAFMTLYIYLLYIAAFALACFPLLVYYTFKQIGECSFNIEITTSSLNYVFYGFANSFNIVYGVINLGARAYIEKSQLGLMQYAQSWMYISLFNTIYCLIVSGTQWIPGNKSSHLGVYICCCINCLGLVFEYCVMEYNIVLLELYKQAQPYYLGFITIVSVFWAALSLLFVQVQKNLDLELENQSYTIDSFHKTEHNHIMDFKAQHKINKLTQYISNLLIIQTQLMIVCGISFGSFSTENFQLLPTEITTTFGLAIAGAIINCVSYALLKTNFKLIALYCVSATSVVFLASPLYVLCDIAIQYSTVENAQLMPEVTSLKISMALSTLSTLIGFLITGLSVWAIVIKRSLRY